MFDLSDFLCLKIHFPIRNGPWYINNCNDTVFSILIFQHSQMRTDCDVRDFLTMETELPKANNTVTLSSAGVKRMFKSVGEVVLYFT